MVVRAGSRRSSTLATMSFYLSGAAGEQERLDAAQLAGSVVLRGEEGAKHAHQLRRAGWVGPLRLDPSDHEQPHSMAAQGTLWSQDPWLTEQHSARVTEYLSPGSYVHSNDRSALRAAIAKEATWLSRAGSGRLSLALHWPWLTTGLPVLLSELGAVKAPLSLAFADQNDPLRSKRAVSGLVTLLSKISDVMINRSDIAALGAIANGSTVGAVGTGTSVRHTVPPGQKPGGAGSGMPSAFVPSILGFKHPDMLLRLPRNVKPACQLSCCGGASLDRFVLTGSRAQLRHHNLVSLSEFAGQLLSISAPARAGWFKAACQNAIYEAGRIEASAGQPFDTSEQVAAWASV